MGATTDELTTEELTAMLRAQRGDVSRDLDAIGDRMSPRRMAERRRQRVSDRVHDVRDRLMGTASETQSRMGDRASSAAEGLKDQVTSMPDRVAEGTRGAPLVAGALAFGAGFLIAVTVPQTDTERRLVDEHRDELQQAATTVKDSATEAAHEMADHLGSEARVAADDLKESARGAAEQVKGEARGAAEQVKGEARR